MAVLYMWGVFDSNILGLVRLWLMHLCVYQNEEVHWCVLISVSSLTISFNVENGQFDHLCRLNIKSELFPLDICWLGNNRCCLMGCPQDVWLLSACQARFFFTAEVFWTRKQMDHSETYPQISWRAESARIKVHSWVGSNRVKEFFSPLSFFGAAMQSD